MVLIWGCYLEMRELLIIFWSMLGMVNSAKAVGFSCKYLREAISNKT